MLVGAGEIDAAMLVVAADDGPRAQTLEHLSLLDALAIDAGIAVVTKIDLVSAERATEVIDGVRELLRRTSLRSARIVAASSTTGVGIDAVRDQLADLQRRVLATRPPVGPMRLAIDRVFSVRGRGVVVTGSLRGGAVARGDVLRVEPAGLEARVREIQVHNRTVERAEGGGRIALNLAGVDGTVLRRGFALTFGRGLERSARVLVALRAGDHERLRHGLPVRLHLGTDQVDGQLDLGRRAGFVAEDGRSTAILRLERPVAVAFGDALVLRRPSPGETLAGGRILDPLPPRGVSRRRMDAASLARLLAAEWGSAGQLETLVAIHGALPAGRSAAWAAAVGGRVPHVNGAVTLADDVLAALESVAVDLVRTSSAIGIAELRVALVAGVRRRVTLERGLATLVIDGLLDALFTRGRLVRDGDRAVPEGVETGPSAELLAAMNRLEGALAVPSPPSLSAAAAAAGCSIDGIRVLEAAGRIVRVEDDLAWEAAVLRRFESLAVRLASTGPLSPAAFRDATGTSRRYALAILEDLDRRAVLRRTPDGHVPGPQAWSPTGSPTGLPTGSPTAGRVR